MKLFDAAVALAAEADSFTIDQLAEKASVDPLLTSRPSQYIFR
jgi:hypothetical protein